MPLAPTHPGAPLLFTDTPADRAERARGLYMAVERIVNLYFTENPGSVPSTTTLVETMTWAHKRWKAAQSEAREAVAE